MLRIIQELLHAFAFKPFFTANIAGEFEMTVSTDKPTWKVVVAFILDLLTSFVLFGYLIALVTGDTTESGFQLTGLPALAAFAAIIAYMVLMPRVGGRFWQRIFGVA